MGSTSQPSPAYATDPPGRGRYVDPALISALTSTAATAAHELAVLADTQPQARRVLQSELGLARKISISFLQVRGALCRVWGAGVGSCYMPLRRRCIVWARACKGMAFRHPCNTPP